MTVSCIAIAKSIVRGEFVTTNNPLAILLANMPIYTYLYTRLPSHSKLPISPFTITILGIINLSLIHISEPTRLLSISYAVFCLKKKKKNKKNQSNVSRAPYKKT
eukprot:TRINITY_DN5258_c0_g1_i1.p2 TRINITY_DN5258_c0_g1~~TRINITY_DN5258_c0_g1_i1.p2  ORF type:complete len:105 (-),score=6.73 TRINITY_DN5258_c0_g1_i1:60-374(-)